MKRTNTTLSRTGFSVAFMAVISFTTMITSMSFIQQGDNVASATSQNTTIAAAIAAHYYSGTIPPWSGLSSDIQKKFGESI